MDNPLQPQPFLEWLRQQGDRKFAYMDGRGCAIASYLREQVKIEDASVGGYTFTAHKLKFVIPPEIIRALEDTHSIFTARELADQLEGVI